MVVPGIVVPGTVVAETVVAGAVVAGAVVAVTVVAGIVVAGIVEPGTVGEEVAAAHAVTATWLVSRVTAALRAISEPVIVVPVLAVMALFAITIPLNAVLEPKVAELPTCQTTLQAWAPLINVTAAPVAVVKVEPI